MIHYLIHDTDGSIRQRGHCDSEGSLPVIPGLTVEVISANDPRQPSMPIRSDYQDQRRMAYPAFGEQLDVLWKLMAKLPALAQDPAAKAMFDSIQAVKTKYPKE